MRSIGFKASINVFCLTQMYAVVLVIGDKHHPVAPCAVSRVLYVFLKFCRNLVCLLCAGYGKTTYGDMHQSGVDVECVFVSIVKHADDVICGIGCGFGKPFGRLP